MTGERTPELALPSQTAVPDGSQILETAEFLYDRAEYSRAVSKAGIAVQIFQDAGDLPRVFDAREMLGKASERLGQYSQALELQESNLQLSHELADEQRTRKALLSLGVLHYNHGDYSRSIEHYSGSLTLAIAQNDTFGQGAALGNLGNVFERMGDYAAALQHHLRCLELFSTSEYREQQSYALNNIGNVYTALQDYRAALDYHRQSLALKRETGDRWGEASSLYNLGICHFRLGELDDGERLFHESLALVKMINDREGIGLANLGLGQIAAQRQQPELARSNYQQALNVFSELGSRHNEAEAWRYLGEVEAAGGHRTQAIASLQKAVSLAESVDSKELLRHAHALLAEHYEQQQQYQQATQHLKLAHAAERELYNGTNQQQLQSLRIRFEVDRTSREKELYRLRNVELAEAYEKLQDLHSELQSASVRQQSLLSRLETQRILLERQSREDALTGLYNRRFFDAAFRQEHSRVLRSRSPLSVALCDIDDFKAVNDRFSHSVGDQTLQMLATLMLQASRSSDVIARYGGEEFALLLPDTNKEAAAEYCERVRSLIQEHPWEQLQLGLSVTISIGVATDTDDLSIEELMRHADRRLYQAKAAGKNRVVTADDEQ